jgi:hypothetical protein
VGAAGCLSGVCGVFIGRKLGINPRDAMVREAAIQSVFILTATPQELLSIHAR